LASAAGAFFGVAVVCWSAAGVAGVWAEAVLPSPSTTTPNYTQTTTTTAPEEIDFDFLIDSSAAGFAESRRASSDSWRARPARSLASPWYAGQPRASPASGPAHVDGGLEDAFFSTGGLVVEDIDRWLAGGAGQNAPSGSAFVLEIVERCSVRRSCLEFGVKVPRVVTGFVLMPPFLVPVSTVFPSRLLSCCFVDSPFFVLVAVIISTGPNRSGEGSPLASRQPCGSHVELEPGEKDRRTKDLSYPLYKYNDAPLSRPGLDSVSLAPPIMLFRLVNDNSDEDKEGGINETT
jgi:hypothetical protein